MLCCVAVFVVVVCLCCGLVVLWLDVLNVVVCVVVLCWLGVGLCGCVGVGVGGVLCCVAMRHGGLCCVVCCVFVCVALSGSVLLNCAFCCRCLC